MSKNEDFQKIRDWAHERGLYDHGDVKTQFVKLQEETGELARAIIRDDFEAQVDAIGDAVVVLTNLAHLAGTSIETCIEAAWNEIKDRRGEMHNGSFARFPDDYEPDLNPGGGSYNIEDEY